jgi:class II flagellar assembly regulator FliX
LAGTKIEAISAAEATMRIYGPNGTSIVATASQPRRASSTSFKVEDQEEPRQASAAPTLRTIGGIEALLALQGLADPAERRRRAIGRGRNALDALDELKLGVLAGTLDAGALARLKSVATELRDGSGEAKLDIVLAEIELRVEVELAKFGSPVDR